MHEFQLEITKKIEILFYVTYVVAHLNASLVTKSTYVFTSFLVQFIFYLSLFICFLWYFLGKGPWEQNRMYVIIVMFCIINFGHMGVVISRAIGRVYLLLLITLKIFWESKLSEFFYTIEDILLFWKSRRNESFICLL